MKNKRTFFRYVPVSSESRDWGAYVLDAGFTLVPPGSPYPPYRHPATHDFNWQQGRTLSSYTFVYITRGEGEFESHESGRQPVRAGDLFVVYPEIWHRYQPGKDTGWDEYWIEFDGDYARRLMNRKTFTPRQPVLHVGYHRPLLQLFFDAVETLRSEPAEHQLLLGALAIQIIAHTLSALKRRSFEGRPVEDVIREAKQLLAHQAGQHHRLEEFASQLNLSYSSFRRLFKEQTGFSPRQFALQVCLGKAKDLLARTELPVYLVAEEVGFESVYYFSKFFRQKTGMTPTDFRSRNHPSAS